MDIFKLERPNLDKVDKEKVGKMIFERNREVTAYFQNIAAPSYLYWDNAKYKSTPEGFNAEEIWFACRFLRRAQGVETAMKHENGSRFTWIKLAKFEEFLHKVDMKLGGHLMSSYHGQLDEKRRALFVSRGILEEAIASSQLEGADTTRKVAKQLIREGRRPKTKSEQMIVNNHEVMELVEQDYVNRNLDEDFLFELHRKITYHTDVPEAEQGRFRKNADEIIVQEESTGVIYHTPPEEAFLKDELRRLIHFANDQIEESAFTHPMIKAIIIHFWIGYLHPFTDGNGRMARILFYWYLLKHGYWAASYLPISKVIKRAKKLYTMAYVYSEQDEEDLTYFIDYHIKRIELAMEEFDRFVIGLEDKNKKMNVLSKKEHEFNDRQIQTLQYLSKAADEYTTIQAHMSVNQISRKTAYNDLKPLEAKGFLTVQKKGKRAFYLATPKIAKLFETRLD